MTATPTGSDPDKTSYADAYRGVDFRRHPERYRIGRGEQGVLMAEPYKSEILPHWKFRTPSVATQSADTIYDMFRTYLTAGDFVGADMARKFLQMGFTRARRYANHPSGRKYAKDDSQQGGDRQVMEQAADWQDSEKAESARIFYAKYAEAKDDPAYLALRQSHKQRFESTKPPKQ